MVCPAAAPPPQNHYHLTTTEHTVRKYTVIYVDVIFMALFVCRTTAGREIGGPTAVCVLGYPPMSHLPGSPGSPAVQPE